VEDVRALRDGLVGECAVLFWAAQLGSDHDTARGHARVRDAAGRLGLSRPPAVRAVRARPVLIQEWAAACGLIEREESRGGRV
jgi:hypothetical protein